MFPYLFRFPEWVPFIGGQPITSFGVMMFLAFLSAGAVHRSETKRQGGDPDVTWDLLFMAIVGGILGAKVYYLFLNFPRLVQDPASLIFARGGLVWYGGFLGGLALVVWRIRQKRLAPSHPGRHDRARAGSRLRSGADRVFPGWGRLGPPYGVMGGNSLPEWCSRRPGWISSSGSSGFRWTRSSSLDSAKSSRFIPPSSMRSGFPFSSSSSSGPFGNTATPRAGSS